MAIAGAALLRRPDGLSRATGHWRGFLRFTEAPYGRVCNLGLSTRGREPCCSYPEPSAPFVRHRAPQRRSPISPDEVLDGQVEVVEIGAGSDDPGALRGVPLHWAEKPHFLRGAPGFWMHEFGLRLWCRKARS